jgi:hypothetical protein
VDEKLKRSAQSLCLEHLVELPPLTVSDIDHWVTGIVAKRCPDLKSHSNRILNELYKEFPERTEVHMQDFLRAVLAVVQRLWPNAGSDDR